MQIRTWAVAVTLAALLAGCGDTPMEQGLLGAGAGGVVAMAIAAGPLAGAVVGAAGNIGYCQSYPERC